MRRTRRARILRVYSARCPGGLAEFLWPWTSCFVPVLVEGASFNARLKRREVAPEPAAYGGGVDVPLPGKALLYRRHVSREDPYVQFSQATEKAGAVRTLESLARIELGAQGGALLECTTTTRTAKNGTTTTTVRERFTPPDWRADGWFLDIGKCSSLGI